MNTLNIFRTAEPRLEIASGEILFSAGEAARVMYAVLEGELEGERRTEQSVDRVEPGGVVGEPALIHDGAPRSATVRATRDSVVVPVGESEFLRHVHATPFFALQILRITADRLKRTNELIGRFGFRERPPQSWSAGSRPSILARW